MAYRITEECIGCGCCYTECPVDAIDEADDVYVIDPAKCVECEGHWDSPRCAAACSVGACVPDPDHPKK